MQSGRKQKKIRAATRASVTAQRPTTVLRLRLKDLDVRAWYHLDVDYVLKNSIMKGTSTDVFSPNGALTRAMLVTILYRTEQEPKATGASTFEDVKPALTMKMRLAGHRITEL